MALQRLPDLDLSGTEWPDLPHSEIVNAAIARARGLGARPLPRPPRRADPAAAGGTPRRGARADRAGQRRGRAAAGGGAGAAGTRRTQPGHALALHPLYPLLAAHAGARPVSAEHGADGVPRAARAWWSCATRSHPNCGSTCARTSWGAAPAGCRRTCTCCSTRRSAPPGRGGPRLLPAPHLRVPAPAGGADVLKVYGLSGLRAGYAVSSDTDLLAAVAPCWGERADPGGGRARAANRRRRDRAPPPAGEHGSACGRRTGWRAGRGGHPLAGELPLVRAPGLSGDALAQARAARACWWRPAALWARTITSAPRCSRGGDATAGAGVRERRVTCVTRT